jgi:hypothetical protein
MLLWFLTAFSRFFGYGVSAVNVFLLGPAKPIDLPKIYVTILLFQAYNQCIMAEK